VLRAGDRVRITAQLIDAKTERHLWAQSYDRNLRDVLAVHSEVARAVTHEIRVKLTPAEQFRLNRPRPVNPATHEAYLRGEFDRAIELDPNYAPAYAGKADALFWTTFWSGQMPSEGFAKAKDFALKASRRTAISQTPIQCWPWCKSSTIGTGWKPREVGSRRSKSIQVSPTLVITTCITLWSCAATKKR